MEIPETIPVDQWRTGTNANSVKSDDSSPRSGSGRGSPPPKCAICLGTCKNKSFIDSCLHEFCFNCLLTWSKIKPECPLCKQNFKSIIHNVQSNHQYEQYMVEQRHTEETLEIDSASLGNMTHAHRRFRYRTTLTLPRRSSSMAIEQLLMHYPLVGVVPPPRRRSPAAFRRTVYRHNLWARLLPDFTGRFRDCSPEFYRYNPAQMHRLVPWLNRELNYLLNENLPHISYVLTRILELLPQYHINTPEFREAMHYFGERAEHFLHELYCFASTPYDMTGYDRNVQYTTDPRVSTMVNEVISSSDSDSADSDIVMVSSSAPAPRDTVVPIETLSHSDSDDGSEVMVVGYIKPPQDRTPEVVDLLGSDSDVVLDAAGPSSDRLVRLEIRRLSPRASPPRASPPRASPPRKRRRRASSSDPDSAPSSSDTKSSSTLELSVSTPPSSDSDSSSRRRPRKRKARRRTSRDRRRRPKRRPKEAKVKRKSRSSAEVKSSRRKEDEAQPGTSGLQREGSGAGSGAGREGGSGAGRRLQSVVHAVRSEPASDSEDDLPLNLTINK